MGLLTHREQKKHKKKLTIDMSVEALQESMNFYLLERRYREAMQQIKEIWQLKARPWIYSSTMVTYIECLIREGNIRDVALVEKQLMKFYISVLDMSPRLLMNFAHKALTLSSSRRAVYAALLSYYAAVLAQHAGKKQKAMHLTVEGTHLIKEVIQVLNRDEMNVADHLLYLMDELKRSIGALETEDNKKIAIKEESINKANIAISEAKTAIREKKIAIDKSKSTKGRSCSRSHRHSNHLSTHSQKHSSIAKDYESQSAATNDRSENVLNHSSSKSKQILRTSHSSKHASSQEAGDETTYSTIQRQSVVQSQNSTSLPDSSLSIANTTSDDKPIPYEKVMPHKRCTETVRNYENEALTPYYITAIDEKYV